jgi:hypothetical protein
MKNKFSIIVFLTYISFLPNPSKGQTSTFSESGYKPVVIWVYSPEVQKEIYQKVSELTESKRNKYQFFLLSDTQNSKAEITKRINDFLNTESGIDKQKIYFLEWGSLPQSQYFENNDKDIFADFYYHQIAENNTNFNLEKVLTQFDSNYLWDIRLIEIEEKSIKVDTKLRRFSYGLTWTKMSQNTFKEDSAYLPPSVGTFGLTVGYRINPRLYLFGRGQFSLNIPDMSNTQSALFSQINFSKGGKQKVALDIEAHVLLQGSVQANYFLTNNQKFRPFIGGGFTYVNFRSAKVHKETEIDVSNIFAGGGLPNTSSLGGLNGADGDLPFFKGSVIKPFFSAGISYKLFKYISLIAWGEYTYNSKDELNGVKFENNPNNFSFNYGIQFEFNKKGKKYYHYLKE